MSGFQDFVGSNSACAGINPTMQLVNQLDKDGSFRKGKFPEQGMNFLPATQEPVINAEQHKTVDNFFNNGNVMPEMQNSFQFQNLYNEMNNVMAPAPVVPNMMVTNAKPPTVEVHKPAVNKMDNWANDFMNEANNVNFINEFNQMQTPQPQLQPFNNPLLYQNPMSQFQFQTPYATMLNNNVNASISNVNKQGNINKQELDEAFENAKLIANNETEAMSSNHIQEEAEKWVDEFSKQQEFTEEDDQDLAEAARLVLDSVQYSNNPKFRDSKFMDFMKQIRDHEVTIKENKVVSKNEKVVHNKASSSSILKESEPSLNPLDEVPDMEIPLDTEDYPFSLPNVNNEMQNMGQPMNNTQTNIVNEEQNVEELQNNELNIDPVELTKKLNAMHKEKMDELHERNINTKEEEMEKNINEHIQNQQQTPTIRYNENVYNHSPATYDQSRFGEDESFEMSSPSKVWEPEWNNYYNNGESAVHEENILNSKGKGKETTQYLNNSTYDNASINLAESSYLQQQNLNNNIPVSELSNLMRDRLDINSEVASTSTQYQESQRGQETDEEINENVENDVVEGKQYSLEDWVRDYQNNIKDIDIDSKNKEWAGIDTHDKSENNLRAADNLYSDYVFQKKNPFLQNNTIPTLEEAMGFTNLAESILALEAIVQTDSKNANAWLQLGNHQQENERESQAISALKKATELDPKLLDAWMSLAISYSNEEYIENSYDALESWILNSDKYNHLLKKYPMFMNHSADRHKFLTDLLLECARFKPGVDLDPDVQIGLGLLFNLSGEYDKAIDCFEAAIYKRPMDHILYNRLGAMLANNNEPQKAIEAYFHALEINPSYIRARYNLAISCMNINEVKEAVEHLLGALSIQSGNNDFYGEGIGDGTDANSTSVWETLRTALITLGRKDLLEKVDARDLESFRNYFDF